MKEEEEEEMARMNYPLFMGMEGGDGKWEGEWEWNGNRMGMRMGTGKGTEAGIGKRE